MNKLQSDTFDEISTKIAGLLDEADFIESAHLASAGELHTAELKILPIVRKKPTHDALDLLARIKAQQGDLSAAKKYWEKALRTKSDCVECKEALIKIAKLEKNRHIKKSSMPFILLLTLFVFSIVIIIFLLSNNINLNKKLGDLQTTATVLNLVVPELQNPASDENVTQDQTTGFDILDQLKENQASIQGMVAQISQIQTYQANPSKTPSILGQISLSVPGVTLEKTDERITITFDEGLFLYDTVLSPYGWERLFDIGIQLEPYVGKVIIEVVGFNDQSETRTDLGLLRATKVITFINNNSQLPLSMFVIRASGEQPAPFPNDTLENMKRNRTVELHITTKE